MTSTFRVMWRAKPDNPASKARLHDGPFKQAYHRPEPCRRGEVRLPAWVEFPGRCALEFPGTQSLRPTSRLGTWEGVRARIRRAAVARRNPRRKLAAAANEPRWSSIASHRPSTVQGPRRSQSVVSAKLAYQKKHAATFVVCLRKYDAKPLSSEVAFHLGRRTRNPQRVPTQVDTWQATRTITVKADRMGRMEGFGATSVSHASPGGSVFTARESCIRVELPCSTAVLKIGRSATRCLHCWPHRGANLTPSQDRAKMSPGVTSQPVIRVNTMKPIRFTLAEWLVCAAIVGILTALLLPVQVFPYHM